MKLEVKDWAGKGNTAVNRKWDYSYVRDRRDQNCVNCFKERTVEPPIKRSKSLGVGQELFRQVTSTFLVMIAY